MTSIEKVRKELAQIQKAIKDCEKEKRISKYLLRLRDDRQKLTLELARLEHGSGFNPLDPDHQVHAQKKAQSQALARAVKGLRLR